MSRKTTLFAQHQALGAVMVNFADWLMPMHYGSQIKEHHGVRHDAGVFDISHMLSIDFKGKDAKPLLRKILANDVEKLILPGKGLYSCLLNDAAGVIDDLIVYRLDDTSYRLVVNAGCREKDLHWFLKQASRFDVSVVAREDLAMLAIQGPLAAQRIKKLFTSKDDEIIQSLKPFHSHQIDEWLISRTGYTGEDGFEIMLPQDEVISLWQDLLQSGMKPIGLGARDTLRLEAGLNLYGKDMDETVTPDESNLGWTVDVKDPQRDFIGKEALIEKRQEGIKQQLVGVVLKERGVCRAKMTIYVKNTPKEDVKGYLTSGGFSPTLARGIGLARIPSGDFSQFQIDIRGKHLAAKMIKLPFVRNGKANFSI